MNPLIAQFSQKLTYGILVLKWPHELKITEELCVMTLKNDEKSEEELTCHFNLT